MEDEFPIATGIGISGQVYDMVFTTEGRDFDGPPIGIFRGICTIVSEINGDLLCTYEITIQTIGSNGLGGVTVTGPAAGLESGVEFMAIVTGTGFDFDDYNTGSFTTVQDPVKPILFAYLNLH